MSASHLPLALVASVCLGGIAFQPRGAPAFETPLQVDLKVRMPLQNGIRKTFSAKLAGGEARVEGAVRNRADRDTVSVDMVFGYEIPPDTIALDEIIDGILVTVEDSSGNAFGDTTTIDPGALNLNPNRTSLRFRVTLYRPKSDPTRRYTVHIRVHGNYE